MVIVQPRIEQGDARKLDLDDDSVDLVVTSPPFWSLRSYTDNGQHYAGQLGAEATPAEYVDNLIECTREMVRVLKPSGSLWINLGDKYRPGKSLIGLPWRFALRCIDDLGLVLRAEVIWSKPNGLPESVKDRVRRSHETWFHFTRSPRYFTAIDTIREGYEPSTISRNRYAHRSHTPDAYTDTSRGVLRDSRPAGHEANPLGKLPGSVWTIATQPLRVPAELGVDHFAAYPMEWPRRIILGWSPSGICTACGEGRRPVVAKESTAVRNEHGTSWNGGSLGLKGRVAAPRPRGTDVTATITGEACACPDTSAPTRPAVVLDPFGGTGTTALMAKMLGRQGISVDASEDYCRVARWRVDDPKQLARAARDNPPRSGLT
jgi:DNA modification methylase